MAVIDSFLCCINPYGNFINVVDPFSVKRMSEQSPKRLLAVLGSLCVGTSPSEVVRGVRGLTGLRFRTPVLQRPEEEGKRG